MELKERLDGLRGFLRVFDRPEGSRIWRPVMEVENVILNQWYIDLFGQIAPEPPGGMDLAFANLALGYGVAPTFDRTDTALDAEWSTTVARLTTSSGVVVGTTALDVSALPFKIPAGHTVVLGSVGAPQVLTLSADANIGDVALAVDPFTPGIDWPVGAPIILDDIALHIPQRCNAIDGNIDFSDPPSVVLSYFLMAGSNSTPITFTEAGLVYHTNLNLGSHVAFNYTKNGNTDLRIDYMLARET